MILDPRVYGRLFAQADEYDVALLIWTGLEFVLEQLQVQQGERVVEGHDLDQALAQGAIKVDVGLGALDANMLDSQADRLVMLHLEVIVIDAVHAERESGRG